MIREVRVPRSDRDMALHRRICDWLWANGIPPGDVPVDQVPIVTDGRIQVLVHARNSSGQKFLRGEDIATRVLTVPLKADPPPMLADWLAGRVDAFGRTR